MDYNDMSKKMLIKTLKQRDETLKNLRLEKEELNYYVKRDYMTGLFNRREGTYLLEKQFNYSRVNKEKFVICFVDVDKLKMINDNFGHHEGDKALICVSMILKKSIRKTDFVIRLGGDEFLIVFPKTIVEEATKIWDTIYKNIIKVNKLNSKYHISLSHGFYEYSEKTGQEVSIINLINKADEEMYKKKIKKRRNLSIYI